MKICFSKTSWVSRVQTSSSCGFLRCVCYLADYIKPVHSLWRIFCLSCVGQLCFLRQNELYDLVSCWSTGVVLAHRSSHIQVLKLQFPKNIGGEESLLLISWQFSSGSFQKTNTERVWRQPKECVESANAHRHKNILGQAHWYGDL